MIDTQAMIRELTESHTHREHVDREHVNDNGSVTTFGEDWVTQQPPLLEQLDDAVHHVRNGDDAGSNGHSSKPTAQIDAIDTLNRISAQAYEWARRDSLIETIRAAHAYGAGLSPCQKWDPRHGCCNRHILDHQIRQWWTWARLTTGWDRPAIRPDATCPNCGKRGGLRIRLDEDERYATCVDCTETWQDHDIGRLAKHIEAEAECTEAGCPNHATRTIRVCDTTYRYLTRASQSHTLRPVGEVSLLEAHQLDGLTT